jgi:hypothetical protein
MNEQNGDGKAPVLAELAQIKVTLATLLNLLETQRTRKDWYTTEEVGEILDRDPYTVREWARLGRIRAEKRAGGRGRAKEWVVSHEELVRIQNHGLLPLRTKA